VIVNTALCPSGLLSLNQLTVIHVLDHISIYFQEQEV